MCFCVAAVAHLLLIACRWLACCFGLFVCVYGVLILDFSDLWFAGLLFG